MYRTAIHRLQNARAPTYMYRFDYDSQDSNAIRKILCGDNIRGVCHGDDMCYLFRFMFTNRLQYTKDSMDCRITQAMVDIWTSFAANSDPNCSSINDVKFEPIKKDYELKCLNISEKMEFITLPELTKITNVWNGFYPQGKL